MLDGRNWESAITTSTFPLVPPDHVCLVQCILYRRRNIRHNTRPTVKRNVSTVASCTVPFDVGSNGSIRYKWKHVFPPQAVYYEHHTHCNLVNTSTHIVCIAHITLQFAKRRICTSHFTLHRLQGLSCPLHKNPKPFHLCYNRWLRQTKLKTKTF